MFVARSISFSSWSLIVATMLAGCATGGGGTTPGGRDGSSQAFDGSAQGTDASTSSEDASVGIDAGMVPCSTAEECSDGAACNGVERCELNRCMPGTPPSCDDGVACTMDRCVEPGTCEYVPQDAMCPSGQTCGATGCSATSTCSESPCRLVGPQCGCATGQACYHSGATALCATAGGGTEGASCTSPTSCAAGHTCIDYSREAAIDLPMCTRYCASDADCSGIGSLCLGAIDDGSGGERADVRLCTRSCDPIDGTGCSPQTTCHVFRESEGAMRFLTDCSGPIGGGRSYDLCGDDGDCARNYACVSGRCRRWCLVATDEGCAFDEICVSPSPTIILGGVQYGFCA
ncbi:hypothetical protein [Sandaracinus amylolyticus]|uniref:Tryptophan synthase alpha chain n=1 Tax=Sandaracinus amylolyticus TaxID=927083 RepID=A0A0F6W4P1_9BACT|nr:hypothetical protein [Sandaracinus amylolyticus]AKF07246.1 Tryptophan synthase alpha chain [Sandaracinus amylolyticus]